eukprot:scaffold31115_cov58-Attheya_sp.AAC.2
MATHVGIRPQPRLEGRGWCARGGKRDHWGIDGIETAPYGWNLRQVEELLKCHSLSFDKNGTSTDREGTIEYDTQSKTPSNVSEMRDDLKAFLKQKSGWVVVNINRHAMGQVGGGNFSPLASYSTARDAFLCLDVAKYKYPPVWVPSNTLFHAIVDVPDLCGIWNFPEAQEQLGYNLSLPKTNTQYIHAKATVLSDAQVLPVDTSQFNAMSPKHWTIENSTWKKQRDTTVTRDLRSNSLCALVTFL